MGDGRGIAQYGFRLCDRLFRRIGVRGRFFGGRCRGLEGLLHLAGPLLVLRLGQPDPDRALLPVLLQGLEAGRHLGLVGVLGVGVHLQTAQHLPTQPVVGQHPLYRVLDDSGRVPGHHPAVWHFLEPTGVLGVAVVNLLLGLAPRDPHLAGVYHYHEIAGEHVRRVVGLVFALQQVGYLHGKPAQHLALGVQNVPPGPEVGRPGRCRYVLC